MQGKINHTLIENVDGKQIDLSKYPVIFNKRIYKQTKETDIIEVKFVGRLPKQWVQQGRKQGYDPHKYYLKKSEIDVR